MAARMIKVWVATLVVLLLAFTVATAADEGRCEDGPKVVLVAAASANTGSSAVKELSAKGGIEVRAMFRKADDPRAAALANLPGVKIVEGDFSNVKELGPILEGVDRVFLVMGAFSHDQFTFETQFMDAAVAAGVEGIVRIGTATGLTHPGASCAYGRAHHGIENYIRFKQLPVVTIRSNWFFSNMLFAAGEIKATGKITYPVDASKGGSTILDARDVASAATLVLLLPSSTFKLFVAAEAVEVQGDEVVSFEDVGKAVSKAVGYPIEYQQVSIEDWVDTMVGYGMPRIWAQSFGDTIRFVAGQLPADVPVMPQPTKTSPLLLAQGFQLKYNLEKWANDPETVAAFKK